MPRASIIARRFLLKIAKDPSAQSNELLKKYLGPQFENPIFQEFLDRGIIPITKPRQDYDGNESYTALLGSGVYNKAYEVSYKGKLAVAKVTENSDDYYIMGRLNELKKKLGSDGKFIATVFDQWVSPTKHFITIVEKLEPLNPHLQLALFDNDKSSSQKLSMNSLREQYNVTDLMAQLNNNMTWSYSFRQLHPTIQNYLLERIGFSFKRAFQEAKGTQDFWREFKQYSYLDSHNAKQLAKSIPRPELSNKGEKEYQIQVECSYIEAICDKAIDTFKKLIPTETYFPLSYGEPEYDINARHFLERPETKEFMKFLYRIKKEYDISWEDLHRNNIMMRPGTGDLVISDPGLFIVP